MRTEKSTSREITLLMNYLCISASETLGFFPLSRSLSLSSAWEELTHAYAHQNCKLSIPERHYFWNSETTEPVCLKPSNSHFVCLFTAIVGKCAIYNVTSKSC